MTNTTANQILTKDGEELLARLAAEEKELVIDKFIFADVPDRPDYPQREDGVPIGHVVHESIIHEKGRLNANSVIYSSTLASDVGPFNFNWSGLYCSEHDVLVTIHHPVRTPKTVDKPGVAGNTLVRSQVLQYTGVADITNITVDASSWQYNADPRMKKMDNDTAQAIIDQNGKDWFIEDGFLVTPQASAFNIKAGAGYVSGNRVTLDFPRSLQIPTRPSFIYVDAHREGTPTGEQVTKFSFVVSADEKDDYTDGQDVKHFVCKIAQVLADGSVSDLRPEGDSASRDFVIEIDKYKPPVGPHISTKGYLDRNGVWAEDAIGIQEAADYIKGLGKRDTLKIAPHKSIVANSLIELDVSFCNVEGNGSELDCSSLISGAAFNIYGSVNPPYEQSLSEIKKLRLKGPGRDNGKVAWLFETKESQGGGSNHVRLQSLNTQGFGVGEKYSDRAYLVSANGCDIYNCGIGLWGAAAVDGGENMQRFGGAIFNSNLAIKMGNPNGAFHLFGTSIDYNKKIADVADGMLMLKGCHVEASDYDDIPLTLSGNGSSIFVNGGWWLLSSPFLDPDNNSIIRKVPVWVDAAKGCIFNARGVRMNNMRTLSDAFGRGEGDIRLCDMASYNIHENFILRHETQSRLVDGSFESQKIKDDMYITKDSAPVVSRHDGDNITVSTSLDYSKVGSRSLKYTKTFGSGSYSEFALVSIPVQPGEQIGGKLSFLVPDTYSSNSRVRIDFSWAKVGVSDSGVPYLINKEVVGDSWVDLDLVELNKWKEFRFSSEVVKAPSWATHFVVLVDGFSWIAEGKSIYFDDINFDCIG